MLQSHLRTRTSQAHFRCPRCPWSSHWSWYLPTYSLNSSVSFVKDVAVMKWVLKSIPSPHAPHLCFNKRPALVRREAAGRWAAAAPISGQTHAVCFLLRKILHVIQVHGDGTDSRPRINRSQHGPSDWFVLPPPKMPFFVLNCGTKAWLHATHSGCFFVRY